MSDCELYSRITLGSLINLKSTLHSFATLLSEMYQQPITAPIFEGYTMPEHTANQVLQPIPRLLYYVYMYQQAWCNVKL